MGFRLVMLTDVSRAAGRNRSLGATEISALVVANDRCAEPDADVTRNPTRRRFDGEPDCTFVSSFAGSIGISSEPFNSAAANVREPRSRSGVNAGPIAF